jgi:hypothetical protein
MSIQSTPFLTQIDPREKVKGSRDPLGFQPLWAGLGRYVVQNLTTVTTSLREFTTLLLGYYFTEEIIENGSHDLAEFSNFFLKFEQLAAYSRYACNPKAEEGELEIRGIQRVKERLQHNDGVVRISADPDYQILSDQKTYGLWGLYTVASRNSGFLEQTELRLTRDAREFIEKEYLPRMDRDGDAILPFLEKDRDFEPLGKDKKLAKQLAVILSSEVSDLERSVYDRHLLSANGSAELQRITWETIREINQKKRFAPENLFSMPELRELIKTCQSRGKTELADRLINIRSAETVFAPAAILFNFLQDRDQQDIPTIAKEVGSVWKKRLVTVDPAAFSTALATVVILSEDIKRRLIILAEAMSSADYSKSIQLLLEQNTDVMRERGGSPWILLKEENILDVHYRENTTGLVNPSEIPDLWMNSYFLNSLKRIGYQIYGGSA